MSKESLYSDAAIQLEGRWVMPSQRLLDDSLLHKAGQSIPFCAELIITASTPGLAGLANTRASDRFWWEGVHIFCLLESGWLGKGTGARAGEGHRGKGA